MNKKDPSFSNGDPDNLSSEPIEKSSKTIQEKKLTEATQLFRSLFENHPDAVFSFDTEGNFISLNPSAVILSEGSAEDIIGKSFSPFIPEEELVRVFTHFQKALNGETQNYVTDFLSLKGSKKIIHVTNFPIVTQNVITGVFGIARDITEPEINKRKIAESEQRYKRILDQSIDVICTINERGKFVEVSAASLPMWGYNPEEMIGNNYMDFVYEEDREKTALSGKELMNKVVKTNFANRYIRKDKTIAPVIWSARWDENDKLMYCIAKDASEIQEAQKLIIRERNLLKAIIDNIPDYIYVLDQDQRTILSNKKFYRDYLGGTNESVTFNKLPLNYFPGKEGELIMEDNLKIMKSGQAVINREDMVYDHQGKKEVILMSKVPFATDEGEIAGLVGIGRNITLSHNFEQEQKLIFRLINSLSKAPNLTLGLKRTIQIISKFLGFDVAEAWEVGYDSYYLRKIAAIGKSIKKNKIQEEFKICRRNEGLAGVVWQQRNIQIWDDLKNETRFIQKELLPIVNSGIGVPLIFHNEVIAVLTFYWKKETHHPDISTFLKRLSVQISTALQRKITENQLNNMFKYSPNLIAVIGLDGYLKRVNPTFQEIFGYTEQELLSQPFKTFLHPEEIEVVNERLREVASGLKPHSFQNRCMSKNGDWKWISWTPSELIEEEGIVHLFGIDISPIKKVNLELFKYKNVIESSKDGILIFSIESKSFYLNRSLKALLNVKENQLFSMQALMATYNDPKVSERIVSTLLDGKFWEGDVSLKIRSGEIADFWFSGGPVYNERNDLIAIYGHFTDISERINYETTLKKYNSQIKNILESITDGFFSLRKDWTVTYWNKEAENILGISREAILYNNIRDHFPEEHKQKLLHKYSKAFKSGKKLSFEEYLQPVDKWIEVNVYPGKEGLSVYLKDISERKRIDDQVRIAKERYDLVSKATREAVYDWDITKNNLIGSEAYHLVFGYEINENSRVEDWGKNIFPEDKETVLLSLQEALDNPKTEQWEYEYRMITGFGEIAFIIEKGYIIRKPSGDPVKMIGSLRDITDIKKKEKELEKLYELLSKRADELAVSNAELEQFAYIASHDLQEPLRMVTSFLTQLQKKYDDQLDDKARQYIHFASDGAVRMRQIILDLLEYSRVGRMEYRFEPLDMNTLVAEICILQETLIMENDAQVVFGDLPVITAAKTPLHRLLSNLINNAIKYRKSEVSPVVEISVKEKENFWEITVKDNGIGINELFFEKIFVIFQRLHSRDKYSGTGIGLAICKKIVENHGGEMWVNSKEGIGSAFHFTIKKHF